MKEALNNEVRKFWEQEPCGTNNSITGKESEKLSREWFEKIEEYRYQVEPCIFAVAQFTRYRGKKILEIGVGAGTDHLQWARAGAICHGVDLTDAAIETTQSRLGLYGLESNLQRADAETLPFEDNTFDVVYSWGVIHHSEFPEKIIKEIHRVLKKEGVFIGMLYGRNSVNTLKVWILNALLKGKPFRSFKDVIWHHMESIGTKAYTVSELKKIFGYYHSASIEPILTMYDTRRIPKFISRWFPQAWGWFIGIRAIK